MLLVGRFARASGGSSFGGDEFTERVLRWERQGNRILLRSITFELTADSHPSCLSRRVRRRLIRRSSPRSTVEAYGPDSSAVIDVTSLYTTNVPEFTAARGSFDDKRSFIERVVGVSGKRRSRGDADVHAGDPPDRQRGWGRFQRRAFSRTGAWSGFPSGR